MVMSICTYFSRLESRVLAIKLNLWCRFRTTYLRVAYGCGCKDVGRFSSVNLKRNFTLLIQYFQRAIQIRGVYITHLVTAEL